MASLALMPLLSMLKGVQTDTDMQTSVSEKDPNLFKDLLKILSMDNPDKASVESMVERLQKELPDLLDETLVAKNRPQAKDEGSALGPMLIKIGQNIDEASKETGPNLQSEKESVPGALKRAVKGIEQPASNIDPANRKPEKIGTLPNGHTKTPKLLEKLFHANYTSHLFLRERSDEAIATDRVRKSSSLKELVQNAESLNLNISEIDLVVKEEKGTKIAQADQKRGTSPSALPPRTEHISTAAATILENLKKESGPKSGPEAVKKEIVTLQTLLSNEKETKDEIKKPAQKESTVLQKSDFASLLASLGKSVEKGAAPKAKTTLQTDKMATEIPSSDSTADIQMQASKDEAVDLNLHSAKNMEAEHLSRKIVDAKATLRHFAQTLQEQVENYKPPFTRMQLSLDPKELGSVEVTLVSRGNNLHIQVNSNPTAIGIMATHGNELKNQLVSMGFTDVQMQFSMNQQQQQSQKERHTPQDKYDETDEITEFYESLELIVPQYV